MERIGHKNNYSREIRFMQQQLAATDLRMYKLSEDFAVYGYYDAKKAEQIMHDYGLEPWDIDAVIPLSLGLEEPRYG